MLGYEIRVRPEAAIAMCPLCGRDVSAQGGLVIVQRPSGDVVCGRCSEKQLTALHAELCVLRDDTPIDFPGRWDAIERRLRADAAPEAGLGRLLASVALQRDPAVRRRRGPGRGREVPSA